MQCSVVINSQRVGSSSTSTKPTLIVSMYPSQCFPSPPLEGSKSAFRRVSQTNGNSGTPNVCGYNGGYLAPNYSAPQCVQLPGLNRVGDQY